MVPTVYDCVAALIIAKKINTEDVTGIIHPQAPSSSWSALALLILINTPINRTFSESLIVPDYCLFILKNQNIIAIQKWEAFCESGCHCKSKSKPAKSKQKKPIKIASASWHVLLKNRVSDFFGILIFWYTTQLGREELTE